METAANLTDLDRVLLGDYREYAAHLIKIKTKEKQYSYLRFNRVQRYLHQRLEEQLERTGMVRALVLKGRQMGVSTYTAGRFYMKTTTVPGTRTFILTHEDPATQNLFSMVRRIHDNMDDAYRLITARSNEKELLFADMDCGYKVGTAGNRIGIGRSDTLHLFHGSEVAFWPDADKHFTSAMETIPDVRGTEIILESTANGIGGAFYTAWQQAEDGEGDFLPVFLPWYWHDEYKREVPEGFVPSDEELEYMQTYGLTMEQVAWAHYRNVRFRGRAGEFCPDFKQEYPATAEEAFQMSGLNTLIPTHRVVRARRAHFELNPHEPRILGVDIAGGGPDKTRIIDRQGRVMGRHVFKEMDTDDSWEIAEQVGRCISEFKIDRCNIDVTGGLGKGVLDNLRYAYGKIVRGVKFGNKASEEDLYVNKRAEMWGRLADWFKQEGGVDCPDDDTFHRHVCAPQYTRDAKRRLKIEAKEKIRDRVKFSPDCGDAAGLTLADLHVTKLYSEGRDYGRYDREADVKPDWMLN